jgi:hypothetical protein
MHGAISESCYLIACPTTHRAARRIGVNRRGIAPPDVAEPEKVDARTVQRSFEPRYSTSAFNAMLCRCAPSTYL